MELYRKHRPTQLNHVFGQQSAVAMLSTFIEKNEVPHAILLHGPSGCSKTTLARILKEELKCSDNDYIELNCADFRGIDTAREIRSNMGFAPIGGNCRIWVLDEVHSSSRDFMNSILKLLEDCPKHVYFMLCTTDPQKLLPTIRTRCTEIPILPLQHHDLMRVLKRVLRAEDKDVPEEILEQIASEADGSARMALVQLDQVIDLPEEKMAEAAKRIKEKETAVIDLCRALIRRDNWTSICKIIKGLQDEPESVRYAVLGYANSIMLSGKDVDAAYLIVSAFKNNFYDSKKAGLTAACYEVIFGE